LLIIPLLLVVTLYFLREGVAIDSLKIGRFQVQGLYLKLDKKLIARIHYFSYPGKRKAPDKVAIGQQLDHLKTLSRYFASIALDDVVLLDEHYRVVYRDNVLYLSSNTYEVAGTLRRDGDVLQGSVSLFRDKKHHVEWKGSYRYDYRKDILHLKGMFAHQGINGNLELERTADTLRFHAATQPFGKIKPLLDLLNADADTREWLEDRIRADRYQILSLDGVLRMTENGYAVDPMSLTGKARLGKAEVRFEDTLKPVKVASAEVHLKKNVLYYTFQKPTYAKRSLAGSTLYLTNIFGTKPSKLHLELKAKTPYDATIAKVLKVYGVTLPLRQSSGQTQTSVVIDTMVRSGETHFKGRTRLSKGKITFYGMPMTVRGGEVAFDDHRATLHNVDADMGWLRAVLNGTFKYHIPKVKLSADIKRLLIGDKKSPFLLMKNKKKVPVRIQWKNKTTIDLPLYKTKIVLNKTKGFTLTSGDIRPIQPYLKGLPVPIKGGSVTVKTRDNKHYTFSGKTTWPTSYLYDKKGPITQYPFSGTYNGKSVSLKLLGGRIVYDGGNNLVKLDHLYIDGKKLMDQNKKGSSASSRIHVKGTNTLIRYEKYVLLTDRFDLRVHGKSTKFVATKDGDTVRVDLNGNALVVKAHRIKAPMLRALINFGGLSGGHYSLDLHGNLKGTLRGVITIDGGTVSRFKTYNNMIALFNTVPALAALKDPGFSKDGFEVKEGRIEFRVVKNRTYFDMIYVDGKSASISGKGTVSTINGAINMDLAVRTARGIGKLIGSLPIVGYILMGKDKSITTGVKVTGTLENPKVTTNVVMETLLAPFGMFIRTLQSPAHIINQ